MYNCLLKDFCHDTGFHFVEFGSMRVSDFYDGIHLSEQGVRFYVRCLKETVNELLDVKYEKQNNSFQGYRSENTNYESNRNIQGRRDYEYGKNMSRNEYGTNVQGRREQYNSRGENFYTKRYNVGTGHNNWYNPNQERDNMFRMFEYMLQGMRDKGF